jgi:hypothetical protein
LKKRAAALGAVFALAVMVIVMLVATGGDSARPARGERAAERDGGRDKQHGARFEVKDPDKQGKPGTITPAKEAFVNRAYPRSYIPARAVSKATRATRSRPTRLTKSQFHAKAQDPARRASVGADWSFLGPTTGFAPGPTTESLKSTITSGRVTALAVDPRCGRGHGGCRLWVAAAGGGLWRTNDAMASHVRWKAIDNGLPTNAFGSLVLDPTDRSGDTLYAGSGEANAINQAGLGLFKSTDGGDHWALVPGSFAVSHDRSIGAVKIDPSDRRTIWMGTADGRQGQSNVNGGAVPPPGAPPLGVYVSHDGGASFTKAFSLPDDLNPGNEEDGGVTDIELDPARAHTVYASLLDGGVWRSDAADEPGGDSAWKQVFAPTGSAFNRTDIALTRTGGKTRIYAGDGGFDADFNATGEFFRTDDANRPAATLLGASRDNAGWTRLSSSINGEPGFATYQLCQFQCDYDLFVDVDPTNPNVVWYGGSMVYEEIRPLQDATLAGIAPWRSNGRSVMRSTDAGVSWTDMTADTQGKLQPGKHQYEQMHPDQHAIAFDPANSKIAFVGSDGGVVRTDGAFDDMSRECDDPAREIVTETDAAQKAADLKDCHQWLSSVPHRIVSLNDGLADLQFVQLSVDPKNPLGDLLGGTQDNGTFSYSATLTRERSWFESVNGDGAASGFDVGDSNIRYHTYFLGLGDINHHGSDPNFWTFITQPVADSGEAVSFYTPVVTDPKVPGTIYLGAQHVWRTKDNGGDQATLEANCLSPGGVPEYTGNVTCGDFVPLGPDLTDEADGTKGGSYLAAVERAPSDSSTLWVGGRHGRLYVSKNADAADPASVSFQRIDTDAQPGRFVSGIAIDPADPNHAFVSFSGYNAATPDQPGHVFDVHYDPGTSSATWTSLDADLPDTPITDIAYDDLTGDLYVGTDYTVLRRPAQATAWSQAASGLPLASVTNLVLRSDGRVLYGATYGRAAWRLELAPVARITGPDTLRRRQSAVYDGGSSRAFGDGRVSYRWTLPDGGHANGRTVRWRADRVGDRKLTLTVTASDGRSASATKVVHVVR